MSEIKYPCFMRLKKYPSKVVAFLCDSDEGVIVQQGKTTAEKVGTIGSYNRSMFELYVRPKEYEYQVLYKSDKYKLSGAYYKDIESFREANEHLADYETILLEASKREVK